MPSRLEGFRMEPGGEPQRLDGLPRLLFLQRSCSEGREWASEQDAGGGMATLHPRVRGRVSSKRLSSISICHQHPRTQNLMRLSVPSTALPKLIQALGTPPQP